MVKTEAMCAVLSVLVNQHQYGTPLSQDDLVKRAAVEHEGDAKDAIEELARAEYPCVRVNPAQGVLLDNSRFGEALDFLVLKCNRDPQELKWRCSHYEGWHTHEWWPPDK